ncbi:TetR family transcriptional regulator [Mycobacteriaceae bacterium 1482268.1]|nr:TetR family transcriptional regulator [Mycobacteriaceae bacterium 1482268.1]
MARWEPDARGRLAASALDLYTERGFDQTTVAEIAERAGLTERTFFRHFADKREVLFGGQDALLEVIITGIADAPPSTSALDAVGAALEATGSIFADRQDHARQRQAVIAANPSLQERELIKLAAIASAMAGALRRRDVGEAVATLTAEVGVAVFKVAFDRWLNDGSHDELPPFIREVMDELKAVSTG